MKLSCLYIFVLIFLLPACYPGFHDKGTTPDFEKTSGPLLSPPARLRKLSLHIRGIPPTIDEYEDLQTAMEKGEVNNHFKQKISSYISSPNHLGKMMNRLSDLFGVRVSPQHVVEKFFWEIPENPEDLQKLLHADYNSMDLLFQKVIKENLDWNYLFTTKEYKILNPPIDGAGHISDLGFYNIIRPDLPPSSDGTVRRQPQENSDTKRVFLPLVFDNHDVRIAGAFTTSRFISRYNTTLLNKNRKRAAALFRILLCDDMKPLIPADEDISDLVVKSFPKTSTTPSRSFPTDEVRHGTQQSCFACHQKLDPLGNVFRMTGNILGAELSPGALVYPTARGELINIPVQGIGEAAQHATDQIEYKYCQVRRFWDWFIGRDVQLSDRRLRDLVTEFDRVGRKPNDFAVYLVQQPEFQIDQSGTFSREATFSQVKPIFKQCSLCHSGITTKNIPSFENLPFGGNRDSHKLWLGKIIAVLDLNGDGSKASMPPRDSGWTLSTEEKLSVQNWISAGAQDENGNRTKILAEDKKKTGTYGYASLRYLASSDISRMLSQKFPNGWDGSLCLSNIDHRATGYFNPATQETYLKGPSLSFVKWFSKCLLDLSEAEFKKIKSQNLTFDKYLGKSALGKIKNTSLEDLRKNSDRFLWSNIPSEIQTSIIKHLMDDTIGWQVAGRQDEILAKILKTINSLQNPMTTEVFQKIYLAVMLQDEFLTY